MNEYFSKKEAALELYSAQLNMKGRIDASAGDIVIQDSVPPTNPNYRVMGHSSEITSVCYNQQGTALVTAGGDGVVKIWEPRSGNEKSQLRGLKGAALCCAVSPQGDLIAAGSTDKSVTMWNANTNRIKHTCTGHGGKVTGLEFFQHKSTLVTGSAD